MSNISLIFSKQSDDGTVLVKSKPFEHFIGDCDNCKHFSTQPIYHPSGDCTLHGFLCGYGFTCKDFSFNKVMIDRLQSRKPHKPNK